MAWGDGFRTWYRVTGDLAEGVPLVALHGGPGAPHDYLLTVADLAVGDRAVVHYDQVGCGRSTHLPDRPTEFWTVQLFLDELEAVLAGLGITSYDLLGQSWGGMLAAEHAVRRPEGLRRLVIADSPASMALWSSEAARLRSELPGDVAATLTEYEAREQYDAPEYLQAMQVFYDRHVCRVVPNPSEVAATFAALEEDPTVYHTMNGPTEFTVLGSLQGWTVIDRLDAVAVPTLLVSGRYDEATPACVQPFADGIADVRWVVFDESSHMPHIEERDRFTTVVGEFLDGHDVS
ncbi:proline iminopeptidase-family hydrolase [Jatrophihabitans sp. YIM 134969]